MESYQLTFFERLTLFVSSQILSYFKLRKILAYIFFSSFQSLLLTFYFFIHLELIFQYGVTESPISFFFLWINNFSNFSLFHSLCLAVSVKNQKFHRCVRLFLDSSLSSVRSWLSVPLLHRLCYSSFTVSFHSLARQCPPSLVFFGKVWAIVGPFVLLFNLWS